MKVPNYITSLTKADLAEIARATNIQVGRGIAITKSQDAITISIEERAFKRMVWAFNRHGGVGSTLAGLDNISLDP